MPFEVIQSQTEVLRSLLEVGVSLSALADRREVLEVILREARRLEQAEAGTLYIVQRDRLLFSAVQNDRLPRAEITGGLLGKDVPLSPESLAGFVALTGRIMSIPDARVLPSGAPFRLDRSFDAATGYRTRSLLAIPLMVPSGRCVGVLELLNHVDYTGEVGAFPGTGNDGIRSLAAMAAVTVDNCLLQEQLRLAHLDTIMRLSVAAEFRDDDTGQHVRRISQTSGLIARSMGLKPAQVELIEWGSPMHDIGKLGIPDSILLKPGPLTGAERRIVERHTIIGADILGEPLNEIIATAREVALCHHEKWDGSGYPRRLSGQGIPLTGRIVCLADVFDALISRRCYKEPYPVEVAMRTIVTEKARHFDPDVVDAFLPAIDRVLEPYRTGQTPAPDDRAAE